jgi:hypothetical protein
MYIIVIDDNDLKIILDNVLPSSSAEKTLSPTSPLQQLSPQSPQPTILSHRSIQSPPQSPQSVSLSPKTTLHTSQVYHLPQSPSLPPPTTASSQSSIRSIVDDPLPSNCPMSPQSPLYSPCHYLSPFDNNVKVEDIFNGPTLIKGIINDESLRELPNRLTQLI